MRRHVGAVGGIAQLAKPVTKTCRCVWLTEMRHQERLDAHHRRRVDDLAQLWVHRDLEMCFLATFGLALINSQGLTVDMLPPKLDDVATPLASVEQKREGEACLCADGVARLEPFNLIFRSCLVSSGLHLLAGDAQRRVVWDAAFLHRPLEHGPQRVEEVALREWRAGFLIDDALHVFAR